jgi:hypothetical protein
MLQAPFIEIAFFERGHIFRLNLGLCEGAPL